MDRLMNDPIEQRVKTLELKVEFLENWKNTPFIQVTLPVILSMFLVASWANFAFASIDKRFEALETGIDKLETRMDKLESKTDKILAELSSLKTNLRKT